MPTRLLVACPQCKHQYDASKLVLGQQFHCHCGAVLTVQEPRGHDAAAVCCSRCGAPRSDNALSCAYCGADFTLHERDLDTVCPQCLTRVSHKARFCHYCGVAIHPETIAGAASNLTCPSCKNGHTLKSRAWGDVSVLECPRCAGLWMGSESFKQLTDRAAVEGMNVEFRQRPQIARAAEVDSLTAPGVRYRPCAVCGQYMARQNFGRQSGVVIDKCRNHGIWFDADELPRILDWVRAGGLARANEEVADRQEQEEALRERSAARRLGDAMNELNAHNNSFMADALRGLTDWMSGE